LGRDTQESVIPDRDVGRLIWDGAYLAEHLQGPHEDPPLTRGVDPRNLATGTLREPHPVVADRNEASTSMDTVCDYIAAVPPLTLPHI
jgi:hypothetical protein